MNDGSVPLLSSFSVGPNGRIRQLTERWARHRPLHLVPPARNLENLFDEENAPPDRRNEKVFQAIRDDITTAMAARYQQVTDPIRREVAARVDGLLWASDQIK